MLKAFFLALLLVLLPLSVLYSQDYYITEEQKNQLQKELNRQEMLAQKLLEQSQQQQKQLEKLQVQLDASEQQLLNCQKALNTATESLKQSRNKELKNKIIIGTVCITSGITIGLVTGLIIHPP